MYLAESQFHLNVRFLELSFYLFVLYTSFLQRDFKTGVGDDLR